MAADNKNNFIYDELKNGIDNGLTTREIMQIYRLKNTREVRERVRYERLHGKPILSKNGIYYRSEDPAEFDECINRLRKVGIETLVTAKALKKHKPGA